MSSSSSATTAVSSSATTAVSASFPGLGRGRTDERRDSDDGDGEASETGARASYRSAPFRLRNPVLKNNAGDAELLRARNGGPATGVSYMADAPMAEDQTGRVTISKTEGPGSEARVG